MSSLSPMLTLSLLVAAILVVLWFTGRRRRDGKSGGRADPGVAPPPEVTARDAEAAPIAQALKAQEVIASPVANPRDVDVAPAASAPSPVAPITTSEPSVAAAPSSAPAEEKSDGAKPARKAKAPAKPKNPTADVSASETADVEAKTPRTRARAVKAEPTEVDAAPKPRTTKVKVASPKIAKTKAIVEAAPEPSPAPAVEAPAVSVVPAPATPVTPAVTVPGLATVTAIGIPGAAGAPDDLLVLKGVGPKLGALLATLEIRRFDQIAAWGPAEIAKVDENLGAFKGRIARDAWVEQAAFLARGDIAGYEAKFGKLEGSGG